MATRPANTGGWGDIYAVNTPYLDRLGSQIYAQEQQRQQNLQKENERLDQEFARNAANIRDVDVNDYADKYNAWKQAKIDLMKMRQTPRNQKAFIAAQLDANKKLADMSQFGNTSIATKQGLLNTAKALASDKNGEYKDNAHDMLIQANRTPTSQLGNLTYTDETGQQKPYDPLNLDQYKYEGNMVKWQPILTKAEGTKPIEVPGTSTPIKDKNGVVLGTNNTVIKAKNSPLDYYTQVGSMLVGSGAQKSLNATFKFTDDEAQQIAQDYQDKVLNNPIAQKAWGNGVKLPMNALLTPATRNLALQTMRYALSNLPTESNPKPVYNQAAMLDKRQGFQQAQQARSFGQQERMAYMRNNLSKALVDYRNASSTADQEGVLNKFLNNSFDAGTNRTRVVDPANGKLTQVEANGLNIDGKQYDGRFINVPNSVQGELVTKFDAAGKPIYPNAFFMTNDKQTIIPVYFGEKGASGKVAIKPDSKPIDIQTYKAALSKSLLSAKSRGTEVTDEFSGQDDNRETNAKENPIEIKSDKIDISNLQKGQSYIIKGKSYIWNGEKFKPQ